MKPLSLVALLAAATPTFAQSADGEANETPDPLALSMGETELEVGAIYPAEVHGDWEIRCIKAAEGQADPCQLYQLLGDSNGNPVAEINVFPLGGENQPAAGATIITPLETLLTEALGISVDGGAVRKYPFSWCSQIGCFSRLGFSEDDLNGFRRGANAAVIIVPVVAPDQRISLRVSLSGFTAGFKALVDLNAPAE